MAVTFNGITRQIIVDDPADVSLDVQDDIYSRWKDWVLDADNAKYAPALRAVGGDPTVAGQTAPIFYFTQNLWTVYINNGVIVDVALNLYSDDFSSAFVVAPGSGVSNRNSDAVNVNEEDIKNQSYIGARVVINTEGLGEAGTTYPTGTPPHPSSNYDDAKIIASSRNLNDYHLDGTLIFTGGQTITGTTWQGESPIESIIVLTGQDTMGTTFERIGLTGTVNPTSRTSINQCALGDFINFYGIAVQSGLNGNITMWSGATGTNIFDHCSSAIAGNTKPIININNIASNVQFRHYSGGLKFINSNNPNFKMSVDGQGRVEFDSTCTEGEAVVGGTWDIIDNSGPNFTVLVDSALDPGNIQVAGGTVGGIDTSPPEFGYNSFITNGSGSSRQ